MIKKILSRRFSRKNKQHYSLASVINVVLVLVMSAMLLLSLSTYYKLRAFENSLYAITTESLPSVINTGKLYAQMNLLQKSIEKLTTADSHPIRRIAVNEFKQQLSRTRIANQHEQKNSNINAPYDNFLNEANELNGLVEKRIATKEQLSKKYIDIHTLYNEFIKKTTHQNMTLAQVKLRESLGNSIILASQLRTFDKFNEISKQHDKLNNQFINIHASLYNTAFPPPVFEIINALEHTIMNTQDGIITLRQEQLTVLAKIRGHGNFLRNLIADHARLNEFKSFQLNERVLLDASNTMAQVKKQITKIGWTFIAIFAASIGFAYFIQHFVIRRLKKLRNQVLQRQNDASQIVTVSGQDEITDLALSFVQFAQTIERQKSELKTMTLHDALTGVPNRRAFDEYYTQTINNAKRHVDPFAIMLIDVDYFKSFNDNYGHTEGDRCLTTVAKLLQQQLSRQSDMLARYGGEEFAIVLPATSKEGAKRVAQKITQACQQAAIKHEFSKVANHVTVSIGIAVYYDNNQHLPLIEHADQALYHAKGSGRNRWVFYTDIT